MFHIIKTGQQKNEVHYVDFGSKDGAGGGAGTSPPPLLMRPNGLFGGGTGNAVGKRHFVKVNEEMFVREVRKRPILYNTTLKDYKRFSTRHEAWAEVAVAMRLSEQECKKRWRSMRDAFMKVVRNRNEEERKSWIHYRLLEFLLPFIEGAVGRKGAKRLRSTESSTSQTVDFIEDEDTEFVEMDDLESYCGRDPITVSYVTEDGKEVFQMLQDPDTIPEGAVIGIEESEVEDEIDEDEHELLNLDHGTVVQQQQLGDQLVMPHQLQENDDNFIYEDRINSAMLDMQSTYEPVSGQSLVEQMKREALSDGEGSEIQVEEIDMELLLSSNHHQPDNNICHPAPEPIIETIPAPVEPIDLPAAIPPTAPETVTSTGQSTPQRVTTPQRTQTPAPTVPIPTREPPDSSRASSSGCAGGDSDERFLLSCVPILQRLPNKKNQLARLKIQQLLFELEYDEKYSS